MATVRVRGELVRKFILINIDKHSEDIIKVTSEKFGCSRQAIHKHIQRLLNEGAIAQEGQTRNKKYRLAPLISWEKKYSLETKITEDYLWRSDIAPSLEKLPSNVIDIWHYGFTEMFNNVISHSGGNLVSVSFKKTAISTEISIFDDGVGIFKKIKNALDLLDERHSVLELAKGKFTTDPANHSGEGIFFSSRMFDEFIILSGEVCFSHQFGKVEDWISQTKKAFSGTAVSMVLHNHTARTTKKVFDQFTSGDDYGFTKTVIPVKLMQYGDNNLVSRSQAQRLLVRFDRFKVVILDFSAVTMIGQAFADEVFRVFSLKHPNVELVVLNSNSQVKQMISRAQALGKEIN